YIFFNNPTGIILGGVPANASRYGIYNGGAWTQSSYVAFKNGGGTIDPTTGAITNPGSAPAPTVANIAYVKPEPLWSYEVGYKGVIATKLLVDLNYYYSSYTNFLGEQYVVSKTST